MADDERATYGVSRTTRGYNPVEEVRVPDGVGYKTFANATRAAERMIKDGNYDNVHVVVLDMRKREGK